MIRLLNNPLPGRAVNQDEVVRSLKERGFYSSGVLRTGCDAAAPARGESTPRVQRLSRATLRMLSPEDFEKYCQAMRDEENNPHG